MSNFHPDRVMDLILHNEVPPAVNQVETHPFHQQVETQQFLTENKVQIESWGPFAEGKNDIFHNDVLRSVGGQYGKSVAQVILRWLTQRGVVAIPKSVRKERMAENFNVFDFRLSDEDMAVIATLDTGTSAFFDHRDPEVVRRLATAKRNTCTGSTRGAREPFRVPVGSRFSRFAFAAHSGSERNSTVNSSSGLSGSAGEFRSETIGIREEHHSNTSSSRLLSRG